MKYFNYYSPTFYFDDTKTYIGFFERKPSKELQSKTAVINYNLSNMIFVFDSERTRLFSFYFDVSFIFEGSFDVFVQ